MTDIEQKALALVNEAAKGVIYYELDDLDDLERVYFTEALCRAIKQHEAFRQEVSDAVEDAVALIENEEPYNASDIIARFIIAKPDPLVEVIADYKRTKGTGEYATNKDMAAALRAAIEKRGGKITWGEEQ